MLVEPKQNACNFSNWNDAAVARDLHCVSDASFEHCFSDASFEVSGSLAENLVDSCLLSSLTVNRACMIS